MESWKSLLKKHIDLYIESEWHQDHKVSLQYLNVQSLKIGQIHQVWKSIPHDSRAVKRAYPKMRLLTSTYILQENRSRFNQYGIKDRCLFCETGAETMCSRLAYVRMSYKEQLSIILCKQQQQQKKKKKKKGKRKKKS